MERTRREVVLGSLAAGVVGACARPTSADPLEARSTGAEPRNVVLILTDDQRADTIGALGHPFLTTPSLDRLVHEGTSFANAFVTTSLCCPSRASMLTGLYAHAHNVLDNQSELDPAFPTYARILDHAGFDTAHIGKWHMGARNPHPRPGWRRWIGFRGQGRYVYPGTGDPADQGFSYDGTLRRQEGYVTTLLTDEAVAYLREPHPRPFCLVLSHKAVHAPLVPRAADRERFADVAAPPTLPDTDEAWATVPAWLRDARGSEFDAARPYRDWPDFASWYRDYHRTLLGVDDSVAAVLRALEDTGLASNTVVLFTSDNGFLFGDKGVLDKRSFYEGSIRVPLLAWGPGFVQHASVPAMALNVDLAPTILELMGLVAPAHWHGRSLVPWLRGEPVDDWRQDFVYEYFYERQFPMTPTLFGIRTKRAKLSTVFGRPAPDELYDLVGDPGEATNLADDPEWADRRKGLMGRLKKRFGELGLLSEPVWGQNWLATAEQASRAPGQPAPAEEDEAPGEP